MFIGKCDGTNFHKSSQNSLLGTCNVKRNFSLDTRPNENPDLKINFTPVNTAQPNDLITPLVLNHIEFSTFAYYCKGYPNEWSNFDVASVNGWQLEERRFFSFKLGTNTFRINTARLIPTNDWYIISRRTIVFINVEPSAIKAIGDTYDSYLVRNASKLPMTRNIPY